MNLFFASVVSARQVIQGCLCLWLFLFWMAFSWPAGAFLINEWESVDLEGTPPKATQSIITGAAWRDPTIDANMLWIPGGCFKMGSPPRAEGRETDEGPVHQNCVAGFWLGETEVTQGQWRRVMHTNPAQFRKGDAHPVENVSWEDVDVFITTLNKRSQLNVQFRLPTEAEWEFACREGGRALIFSGATEPSRIAWYAGNSSAFTHAIGTRTPNRLGLKDMSGNVWEWVQERYQPTYSKQTNTQENQTDPLAFYTIRGGGWQDQALTLRCANRGFESLTSRRPDLGLRLAASLKGKEKTLKPHKIDTKHMPF